MQQPVFNQPTTLTPYQLRSAQLRRERLQRLNRRPQPPKQPTIKEWVDRQIDLHGAGKLYRPSEEPEDYCGARSSIPLIMRTVARYYNLDIEDLQSRRRDSYRARQVAYYLCKRLTSFALLEIGKRFGKCDHTAVRHGIRKIDAMLRSGDQAIERELQEITGLLGVSL